jgi:DNA-binding NtrC family response regulator/tetratricopeptide (TPR) repeat protein
MMLTHLVRFLSSRRIQLTNTTARVAVRELTTAANPVRRRPIGVIVQARAALHAIEEALDGAAHGGTARIDVVGCEGSGLRTLRLLAARAARLRGYIPIATDVLLGAVHARAHLDDRHLCVLIGERHTVAERRAIATFLAGLGTASARRHVAVRFARDACPGITLEPMAVNELTAMIFADPDCGPERAELLETARDAGGMPGIFLKRLRGSRFDEPTVRVAMVHESSAAYRIEPAPSPPRGPSGIGRALRDAADRADRLAERGRHASAVRLLSRAIRVLEGRRESTLAAACAERLAWIDRRRGRSDRAVEGFEHARRLATGGAQDVAAAIGIGVVWTDEQRFIEAEAALRGACAAAAVLDDAAIERRARYALARCLFWQTKHDDSGVLLTSMVSSGIRDRTRGEALALLARIRVGSADLPAAVALASDAIQLAGELNDERLRALAARAMAIVQAALGDHEQVRDWTDRGLRLAAAAHVPILALRLRAIRVRDSRISGADRTVANLGRLIGHLRTALRHRTMSRLVRAEIEAACEESCAPTVIVSPASHERSLRDLQMLLEIAQGAEDDHAALSELCETLCDRLRAASVQIVAGGDDPRALARAGRPWQGDTRIVERILAGGSALSAATCAEPRVAAEPVRYGQQAIAVMCCRWTAGTMVDPDLSSTLLRAGALAAAASVRSLLDRVLAPPVDIAPGDLVGSSPAAQALRDAIARAARAPFPVLIEGESGSGKELVARGIHRLSSRRDRRLCTVNCAALSDDLLEAELFGHARGAFTGAVGERAGLFEEADGGTLFLDEVGELSARAQAKLLRVLQDGEVRRVGENMPRRVDARIVAASNRCLDEEAAAGRFRADLRFRLDVVRIAVPPLRDRATDIPALALHFWADAAKRVGSLATLTAETLAALSRYDWPGNIRELQNAIASLAVHAPRRGRIVPSMLPAHVARSSAVRADTFEAARHDFERRFVRAALAQAGGQRARAARALGVSRQGLAKMLRRLAIDAEGK